ncbi:MAG: helix-turn-helix domain-containing protein [Firmicutes bacterium]|nr:helix-turn-helix domain-containing protein [Bacillota bacterium]
MPAAQIPLTKPRRGSGSVFLSDPSLKIGEISEEVGYADTAHFARTFRRLAGMSANAYRNTLRSSD